MNRTTDNLAMTALAAAVAWPLVIAPPSAGGPAHAGEATEGPALLGDMLGRTGETRVQGEDTLLDIARRFDLGYTEVIAANPDIDPWLPEPGARVVLATGHLLPDGPRRGIVINLGDQRLYFFPPAGGTPRSYPIGIGKQGFKTPLGQSRIVDKRLKPTWFPPASIRAGNPELPRAVPPGPDNPLGEHALYLAWPGYVIHGTNIPWGIGRRVSHGCVRLYAGDIADLFARVASGTAVTVIDQPLKLGWSGERLYVEIHPSQAQADEIENTGRFTPEPIPDLTNRIVSAAGKHVKRLDWPAIGRAAHKRSGVPVPILPAPSETQPGGIAMALPPSPAATGGAR
jgi:L,D-transpeptidase ErfK/SrfK